MNTEPNPPDQKTCGMCGMGIPVRARKCPYCQHFQNRATLIFYHPAIAAMLATAPLIIALLMGKAAMETVFGQGEQFGLYKAQVSVTESHLAFGESRSNATIAVLGEVRNASPVVWKDAVLQVDFFDAAGKRIEVG